MTNPYELAIVVVQPLWVFLFKGVLIYYFTILSFSYFFLLKPRLLLIVIHQTHYPFALVGRLFIVWRVAHYYHNRCFAFNHTCCIRFVGNISCEVEIFLGVFFLKRVGKKDVQSVGLFCCNLVKSQCHGKFQVSHGVWRHKIFKAINSGNDVPYDVVIPKSLLPLVVLIYLFCSRSQKCSCTSCRIEDLYFVPLAVLCHAVIGNTIFNMQRVAQNRIHTFNNEFYNLLGSVPNAEIFPYLWVVCFEEIFIKMHKWVFLVILKNFLHIRHLEEQNQVLHNSLYKWMKMGKGKFFEYLLKERVNAWYEFGSF